MQRTMLEEFWATVDPKADGAEDQLAVWVQYYNWDRAHEALSSATPVDRIFECIEKTPLWDEVGDAYKADQERIRVRHYVVDGPLQALKRFPETAHISHSI